MQRIVASPIVAGEMIFVPSRVSTLLALDAGGKGTPRVAWSTDDGPDVPTPAVTEDYVFILRDRGTMLCLNRRTGSVVWGPERIDAAVYSASPVVADGRVYVTSEEGKTTVLEAGPEFRVLAENSVEEYTLASLAVADGQIFLRTAEHLYAIGRREG
jgi:outer membrane protein assembly factor BamB